MPLPFSTTTLTFRRPVNGDPYEPETGSPTVVGTVPAVVGSPNGQGTYVGGTQEIVDATANCEPIAAMQGDIATDNTTFEVYRVLWTQRRPELGLDHLKVGLRRSDGAA